MSSSAAPVAGLVAWLSSSSSSSSAAASNGRAVVSAVSRALRASSRGAVREELEAMPMAELVRAWGLFWGWCRKVLGNAKSQEFRDESDDVEALEVISGLAIESMAVMDEGDKLPADLMKVCGRLHGILFALGEQRKLQKKLCKVSEQCWIGGFEGKQELVPQAIPLLVIFSLEDDARKIDVKRVYGLRKMLTVLDLGDDSSVTLKHLLLRCFLSPLYLSMEEGIKFLSEIINLDEDFVADVHETVKMQLPFAVKTNSVANYADIYFRAWKLAVEGGDESAHILARIEKEMIQDFMDAAMHVSDDSLADALFKFLNAAFHDNKCSRAMDEMLLRLYNPIIWRSLSVANPTVRFRATRILARAFPLQDPEASVATADENLQKQFTTMETLLSDKSPVVRVSAVQGVSRMLSVYWEVIPKKATVSLLSNLVAKLLHDASSAEVRVSAINGIELISENPLSHGALGDILRHVSPFIHDESRKVRNALVKLLVRVKSIRSIKFYDVVPVDHLLERLAVDAHLAGKLTKLLQESFYPQGVAGSQQLARSLALLESHPDAAFVFFANIHKHVSVGLTCKLAILLGIWIKAQVANDESIRAVKNKKLKDGSSLLSAVMRGVAALWRSVAAPLRMAKYKNARTQMLDTFGLEIFIKPIMSSGLLDDNQDLSSLLEISGQLPCDETFAVQVLADVLGYVPIVKYEAYVGAENFRFKSSSFMTDIGRDLGPMLECLCFWGKVGDICDTIIRSIGNTQSQKATQKSKRAKKATSKAERLKDKLADKKLDPLVAMGCLQHLLANDPSNFRSQMFDQNTEKSDALVQVFTENCSDPVSFETTIKLCMHRELHRRTNDGTLVESLRDEDDALLSSSPGQALPHEIKNVLSAALDALGKEESDAKKEKKRKAKANEDNLQRFQATTAFALLADCEALGLYSMQNDRDFLRNIFKNAPRSIKSDEKFAARFAAYV